MSSLKNGEEVLCFGSSMHIYIYIYIYIFVLIFTHAKTTVDYAVFFVIILVGGHQTTPRPRFKMNTVKGDFFIT